MKERCNWELEGTLSVWRKFNWNGFSTGTVLELCTFVSVSGGEGGRSRGLLGGVLMVLVLPPSIALSLVVDIGLQHLTWDDYN